MFSCPKAANWSNTLTLRGLRLSPTMMFVFELYLAKQVRDVGGQVNTVTSLRTVTATHLFLQVKI